MADLIDRQAAIEAFICKGSVFVYGRDTCKAIVSRLMQIPSAEPEIIRCKECVDYDTSWIPYSAPDRHYCPTMDSFMPDDGYCSFAERRTDDTISD